MVTEREEENIVDMLSMESLFLLVFGSVSGCYVIIGCGYNGLVNGRAGVDAMPNKRLWQSLCRDSWAGLCDHKRDVLFLWQCTDILSIDLVRQHWWMSWRK